MPFELLKKDFKLQQRMVEKELANVATTVDAVLAASAPSPAALDGAIERLKELKRKVRPPPFCRRGIDRNA